MEIDLAKIDVAVHDLRRHGGLLRALSQMADCLGNIGSLERAHNEKVAAVKAAEEQRLAVVAAAQQAEASHRQLMAKWQAESDALEAKIEAAKAEAERVETLSNIRNAELEMEHGKLSRRLDEKRAEAARILRGIEG